MIHKHSGFTFIPLLMMIVFTSCSLSILHNAMLRILRQEKLFLEADDSPPPLSKETCSDSDDMLTRFCMSNSQHAPYPILQWKKLERALLPCIETATREMSIEATFKQPYHCRLHEFVVTNSAFFIDNLSVENLKAHVHSAHYLGSLGTLSVTSLHSSHQLFIFAVGNIKIKTVKNIAPLSFLSVFGKVSIEEHFGAPISIQDIDSKDALNQEIVDRLPLYHLLPLSYEQLERH